MPHDLVPGAIGRGFGAVIAMADQHARADLDGLAGERLGEGALAEPGLAADQDEAALSRERVGEAGTQDAQLPVTADEGQAWRWCRGLGAQRRHSLRRMARARRFLW